MWLLIAMFVSHGVLVDRSSLYIGDSYSSYSLCASRANELIAAYRTLQDVRCVKVSQPPKGK